MLSLAQALAALPDTADGIAAHLAEKGIRGGRREAEHCPIANYLTGTGFHTASVSPLCVIAWVETDLGRAETADLPDRVNQFVSRFDAGEWPALVCEPEAGDV